MDDESLRAREYLRVSYDRSGRERSNSEQHDDNVRVWSGWEWGEPYSDSGSASRYAQKQRDDWEVLVRDLERGQFDADLLVLWESSRGSREVDEWVRLLRLLEERGVRVAVTEHRRIYDPANPRDRRSMLEDAVDSEYESAKTSRRIRRNTAANAAAGRPHGRVPYGYRRVYDPETGRLASQEPHEAEAAVVRELFERLRAGHSLNGISKDFAARGIQSRNGKTFTPAWLRSMAVKPLYAGVRSYAPRSGRDRGRPAGDVSHTDAVWPGIVDKQTFLAVQQILTNPARRTAERPGKATHLSSGVTVCDPCGGPTGVKNKDGGRRYVCVKKGCVSVLADDLDALVTETVIGYLSRPDNVARLVADDRDDEALQAARTEVAEIRSELADLTAQVGAGKLTATLAAAAEPLILERLRKAEDRESELATPSALRGLIEPGEDVAQRWEAAPISAKRRILRLLLVPEVLGQVRIVHAKQKGRRRAPITERVVWNTESREP